MASFQRSRGQIVLLALSLIGIAISVYLTIIHYTHTQVVCSASGVVNCELVLSSSYSLVPGTAIPVSIPGLLWFVVSAGLAASAWLLWPSKRIIRVAEFVWSLLGMFSILYLVYVEIVRLRTICAWCTGVHLTILVMFLVTIVLMQEPGSTEELEVEGERQAVTGKSN